MPGPQKKGLWLRGRVAKELGITITRVRQLEKKGALKPAIDTDGVRMYTPASVLAFKKKRQPRVLVQGELASEVFRMLADGHPLADIVITLKLPPETVRKLHDEYRHPLVEPKLEAELAAYDRRNAETDALLERRRRDSGAP